MSPKLVRNVLCRKCEGNVVEAEELEGRLCVEMETVRRFWCQGVQRWRI